VLQTLKNLSDNPICWDDSNAKSSHSHLHFGRLFLEICLMGEKENFADRMANVAKRESINPASAAGGVYDLAD